ncbi:MAG: AI-2E family transporter [Clostridia bacterium]|nr:AI-2E family transporter [Clostridia bacterium]
MLNINNKTKFRLAVIIYCSLLLAVILIGQYDKISGIISSVINVLSPLIVGFTMAYLLNPILNFFEKKVFRFIKNKRVLRCVGIFFTYVALALFLIGIGFIVIPQLSKSISEFITPPTPDGVSKFDDYKYAFIDYVNAILNKLKDSDLISDRIDATVILNFINDKFSSGRTVLEDIVRYLADNIESFLIIPRNILLGLFISFYALFTKERLAAQAKKLAKAVLSEEKYDKTYHLFSFTHSTFGGYFTGVIIDAVIVGIITFIALIIFGVPSASLVAVLVAVTNVIPIFGPFLGAIPSAVIIFLTEPSKVIVFIIIILLVQQIDGNIIAPRILGNSTGISSLAVIIAIIVMGSCFGFIGMFIGVPVFAVIIALIKEIIEEKLATKELPVETSSYYPKNSMVDTDVAHVTLFDRLKTAIKKLIKKIFKKQPEKEDK